MNKHYMPVLRNFVSEIKWMKRTAKRLGIEVRRERAFNDELKWLYVFTPWNHLKAYYICLGNFDVNVEWGTIEYYDDPDPQCSFVSLGRIQRDSLRQGFTGFMRSLIRAHGDEMIDEMQMDVDMFEADRFEDLAVK